MEFVGICLITKDVIKLSEFYCKILSTEYEGNKEHTNIKVDGAGISIFSEERMKEMAKGCLSNSGVGRFTIAIKVEDIEKQYNRLIADGVEIIKPLQMHDWGTSSFWFRDVDGNIVNFMSLDS
ncbi:VOC family protein [Clostridiaceae bacterium M8S5]|nr:VOC family protein [Clostridiaceae bacterium M8S5]